MSHTPGPWEVIQLPSMEYRIDAKVGPLHVCPAIAHGLSDAVLIAAAPDLLAALNALVPDADWGDDLPRVKQARAAIARATTVTS